MADSPPRVYFDADVLIAGVHSPAGAAGVLLLAAESAKIIAIVSPQTLEEARRNLAKKLPQSLSLLNLILERVPFEHRSQPTSDERQVHIHLANASDVAHVSAAHKARAAYLLTFNLRHYAKEQIQQELGIRVLLPGDLLKNLRETNIIL